VSNSSDFLGGSERMNQIIIRDEDHIPLAKRPLQSRGVVHNLLVVHLANANACYHHHPKRKKNRKAHFQFSGEWSSLMVRSADGCM